jgi:hypothetical protein
MIKKLALVAFAVLLAMAGFRIAMTSAAVMDQNTACSAHNLMVELDVVSASTQYRLNGSGPGLPSMSFMGSTSHTFMLEGPGVWSDLHAEYYSSIDGTWKASDFAVSPSSITCAVD